MFSRLLSAWRPAKEEAHNVICRRFIQVFEQHGITSTQIPRLIPAITLSHLQSNEHLLSALTPERLDQVAELFGIRVAWLEGRDDEIYDFLVVDKEPIRLLERIRSTLTEPDSKYDQPIWMLCTSKQLDKNSGIWLELAPVVAEKIAELDEKPIFRYHVYRDGFSWDHPPARVELKTVARLVFKKLRITVPLYEVSPKIMDDALEGKCIPGFLRNACHVSSPSLEDFGLLPEESMIAKETDEMPEVLRYITAKNLDCFDFFAECSDLVNQPEATQTKETQSHRNSLQENCQKAANKRHSQVNGIKQRFVDYCQATDKENCSKAPMARTFFQEQLTEKERLLFNNEDSAVKTLTKALRAAQKNLSS